MNILHGKSNKKSDRRLKHTNIVRNKHWTCLLAIYLDGLPLKNWCVVVWFVFLFPFLTKILCLINLYSLCMCTNLPNDIEVWAFFYRQFISKVNFTVCYLLNIKELSTTIYWISSSFLWESKYFCSILFKISCCWYFCFYYPSSITFSRLLNDFILFYFLLFVGLCSFYVFFRWVWEFIFIFQSLHFQFFSILFFLFSLFYSSEFFVFYLFIFVVVVIVVVVVLEREGVIRLHSH